MLRGKLRAVHSLCVLTLTKLIEILENVIALREFL